MKIQGALKRCYLCLHEGGEGSLWRHRELIIKLLLCARYFPDVAFNFYNPLLE